MLGSLLLSFECPPDILINRSRPHMRQYTPVLQERFEKFESQGHRLHQPIAQAQVRGNFADNR